MSGFFFSVWDQNFQSDSWYNSNSLDPGHCIWWGMEKIDLLFFPLIHPYPLSEVDMHAHIVEELNQVQAPHPLSDNITVMFKE